MSATIASNAAAVRSSLKPAELVASRGQLHSLYGTDTSQHIYYIGADNHVHELYAEPGAGWRDNDLTGSTGAPLPVMGTPITGFWGTDKSEHVHFIGVDGNVHELYLEPGNGWKHNNLTLASGGPLPRQNSPLTAYWQADSSQHIDFIGANGHIYELYLAPGKSWTCNDLMVSARTQVVAASSSSLAGYYGSDTIQHINFIGMDGHIHELYTNPNAYWAINDLTQASNGPSPRMDSPLSSFEQADNGQHVHFITNDGHIHEIYLAPIAYPEKQSQWVDNDLTSLSGVQVVAVGGTAIDSYFGRDTSQHINFVGTDGHVHELYANPGSRWAANDLTIASKGIVPAGGSPLCGYMQADNGQHVNFVGGNGHIYELYLATGKPWECNDLTSASAHA